jgi:hypothetical protein
MTIRDDDEFKAALKWPITLQRTATRTSVAVSPFSVFDLAGSPGAGTLAVGNTANGVSHTKATAGYPTFPDAPAGRGWYLSGVSGRSSVAVDRDLYDFVYSSGAHAFNAAQALTSQPSIDDRLRVAPPWGADMIARAGDMCTNGSAPIKLYLATVGGIAAGSGGPTTTASAITDGTVTWRYIGNGLNYAGLEILVEQVTAGTGNQAVNVTYSTMGTDGVTLTGSRTTGAVGVGAALIVGRMVRLPLQAGDSNAALLTNIAGSVATVGTFNVHLARRIGVTHSVFTSPFADQFGYDRTQLPYIPNNAAIREVQTLASTTTATGPMTLTLALG